MEFKINLTKQKNAAEIDVVKNGLRKFNKPYFGGESLEFIGIYARDLNQNIIAGALTYIANNEMLLDTLSFMVVHCA